MYGAVDVGGTKTLVAFFDKGGQIIESAKFPTPEDYPQFKVELEKIVDTFTTPSFIACGLAMPGLVDHKKSTGVAFGNLDWRNAPLGKDAEDIFKCKVFVENDAKLAGLSEAALVSEKFRKVLYLTVSTGIGIALVEDGVIEHSLGDGGGRNLIFEHDGKLMAWEDFASGRAIYKKYGKKASEIDDPKVWKEIVSNLTVGIVDLIGLTVPEVVIIGGGVGSHFEKYGKLLNEQIKKFSSPLLKIPPIIGAKRAEEAVIYGCYEIAKNHAR